jgi:hypothetical protein
MRRTCELDKLVSRVVNGEFVPAVCEEPAVDFVTVRIEQGSEEVQQVWLCAHHFDRFMAIEAAMRRLRDERNDGTGRAG